MSALEGSLDDLLVKTLLPVSIGPLQLRNRYIKSATNEGMCVGGLPSKRLVDFHGEIAAGGVAMTTVAYCAVSQEGQTLPDQIILNQNSQKHLQVLTDRIHAHGCAASAQITHGGCFTFVKPASGKRPISASGGFNKVGLLSGQYLKHKMTRQDMQEVINDFVVSAKYARDSGFDAVEIHMGHGYLLSQFISPLYNKRRDEYGGSIENRMRFPRELLGQVLEAVGKELAVICKYSMVEGASGGNQIAEGVEIAKQLEAEGAHMLVLSAGMNVESITTMFGSSFPPENRASVTNPLLKAGMWLQSLIEKPIVFRELYLLEYARQVRAAVNLPLAYLGGVASAQGAAQVVQEGFDVLAIGRALIHDPAFVNALANHKTRHSGCTACNLCVTRMYTPGGVSCVLGTPGDAVLNQIPAGN